MQSAASETDRLTDVVLERLTWARNVVEALVAAVPDEHLAHRVNGRGNHALWVMGHLAATEDEMVALLTGAPCAFPESFRARFRGGSQPTDDAADYPSRQELLDALRAQRRRTVAWVESMDETTARTPTPEGFRRFAPDWITTAFGMAAHDLMHAGQITAVRAALGLPRLMR